MKTQLLYRVARLFEDNNIPKSAWKKLIDGDLVPFDGSIEKLIADFKAKFFVTISKEKLQRLASLNELSDEQKQKLLNRIRK